VLTTTPTTAERARQFIDDILAINSKYGMRSVTSEGAYEAAVANAARQAERLERANRQVGTICKV
jgi:hypothetical protein